MVLIEFSFGTYLNLCETYLYLYLAYLYLGCVLIRFMQKSNVVDVNALFCCNRQKSSNPAVARSNIPVAARSNNPANARSNIPAVARSLQNSSGCPLSCFVFLFCSGGRPLLMLFGRPLSCPGSAPAVARFPVLFPHCSTRAIVVLTDDGFSGCDYVPLDHTSVAPSAELATSGRPLRNTSLSLLGHQGHL
jgi:hypothetical protein